MRRLRRTALACAGLSLLLVVGACAPGDPAPGGGADTAPTTAPPSPTFTVGAQTPAREVRLWVPDRPAATGWDPRVAPPATFDVLGPAVRATLLRPDPAGGAPTPWLAESVNRDPSARVWTVTLRAGLTFEDGSPLTARDFAFAFTQIVDDQRLASRFGADAEGTFFRSAVAVDDRTLVITVRNGNSALDRLVLAAAPFGCVKEGYGGRDRADYFARPLACGPFAIGMPTRFMQGTTVLVRNPRYFDVPSVVPGRILVRSGARGLEGVDVVVGFDGAPSSEPALSGTALTAVSSAPGDPAVLVVRNARPGSDANLRQALRALVPVPAMRQAAQGAVAPDAGLTPPAWPGAVEVPLPGGRPEVADAAAALVPPESRRLALAYLRGSVTMQQRADALAAAAEPLGLELVPTPLGRADLDRALATGGFDAALVNLAPSVAHAAELTRTYALTRGFGGGWPAAPGARAFPAQLIRPGSPELAVAATDRFEAALRRDATVIPLAIDPRRVLTGADVLAGVVPGVDGSLALETIAVQARPIGVSR